MGSNVIVKAGEGIKCRYTDSLGVNRISYVTWRLMYPNCSKVNQLCNALSGAYVPAVTVCTLKLF